MTKPKKLAYFQILDVRSSEGVLLQPVPNLVNGEVPENCFVATEWALYLPKRKRGEKFTVLYTEAKKVIL